MKKYYSLIILTLLLSTGCSDNPATVDNGVFNAEIKVVNSDGQPLPDINVSIWDKISFSNSLYKISSDAGITAVSSIPYTLIEQCYIELIAYDLNDNVKAVIASGQRNAGRYQNAFQIHENAGTQVYKVKLTASSDSLKSDILFQDSIYAVLWQPDPAYSSIGRTNSSGIVQTSDKLLFPHLIDLPVIPRTSESDPGALGYIIFSDSVTIALTDDNLSQTKYFVREIKNGENKISLNWNDGTANPGDPGILINGSSDTYREGRISKDPPMDCN